MAPLVFFSPRIPGPAMTIIFLLPRWPIVSYFHDICLGPQTGRREAKPRAAPGSLRTGVVPSCGPGGRVIFQIADNSREERDNALKAHARRVDCHLVAGVIDIGFTDDGWRAHICPDLGTPPCLLRMTCCALVRRRLRAHVSICRLLLNEQLCRCMGFNEHAKHRHGYVGDMLACQVFSGTNIVGLERGLVWTIWLLHGPNVHHHSPSGPG